MSNRNWGNISPKNHRKDWETVSKNKYYYKKPKDIYWLGFNEQNDRLWYILLNDGEMITHMHPNYNKWKQKLDLA